METLECFFADENTSIVHLPGENAKMINSTTKHAVIENHGILDYVYLQNFRLFFKLKADFSSMDIYSVFPNFNFAIQPIASVFKFAATPTWR